MTRPRTDLEFTAFYPEARSVQIPANAALSDAIDLDGVTLVGIQMPSAWDAANLTFQVSVDGSTFANLYDQAGSEVTVNASAGRYIVVDHLTFLGIRYLKVRSGTSAAPVNQTASRVLTVVVRSFV